MEARELRIGNIITCNYGTGAVDVINNELQSVVVLINPKSAYDMLSRCKGVLLTEEWLFKFGFVKINVKLNKFYAKGICVIEFTGLVFLMSYTHIHLGRELSVTIEYVHQLQNLYFALTGEELTIKEPA